MFAALGDKKVSKSVQKNIDRFIALAPVVYLNNQEVKLLEYFKEIRLLESIEKRIGSIPIIQGVQEDSNLFKMREKLVDIIPDKYFRLLNVADRNPEYNDIEVFRKYMKLGNTGASLRSLSHWRQSLGGKENFGFYDLGKTKNLESYGCEIAP